MVQLEGIACGCVPVTSRIGGLPGSVGEAGLLFKEGDCEELADALLRLLQPSDLLEKFRAKAGGIWTDSSLKGLPTPMSLSLLRAKLDHYCCALAHAVAWGWVFFILFGAGLRSKPGRVQGAC